SLSLAEMDQGSWVIFELPGFTKAASGTEQPSMDALRKANATSYFRGGDALWGKLVVTKPPLPIVRPTDLQASITGTREDLFRERNDALGASRGLFLCGG